MDPNTPELTLQDHAYFHFFVQYFYPYFIIQQTSGLSNIDANEDLNTKINQIKSLLLGIESKYLSSHVPDHEKTIKKNIIKQTVGKFSIFNYKLLSASAFPQNLKKNEKFKLIIKLVKTESSFQDITENVILKSEVWNSDNPSRKIRKNSKGKRLIKGVSVSYVSYNTEEN